MSFRRDEKKANFWRYRLERFPELLQRIGLPEVILQDEKSLRFFLNEGCYQQDKDAPLVDWLKFLSDQQLKALYELLSEVLTEPERIGTIWSILHSRIEKKKQVP